MTVSLHQSIEIWAGNPFRITDPCEREASRLALLDEPLVLELRRRIRQEQWAEAKRILLALGHAQACDEGEGVPEALHPQSVPPALMDCLPRPRGDYQRIVNAAGRCYRSMSRIRGKSAALAKLRLEIWNACFGQSLLHALDLEGVIRDHDVLILGETGTGKEAVAQVFLEAMLGDAKGGPAPRSAINAAAIPETLVESELFGHAKGAFTGASEARSGRLRVAAGGAFFLDEVGDLPTTTQVKLLRVMETNEVYPLGSDTSYQAELRYIAATHKDLAAMVEANEFRRDLYGRLAGVTISIPPLRERPEDIEAIAHAFIEPYLEGSGAERERESIESWLRSREAREYEWPGNVRELQNVLRNLLLGLPSGVGASTTRVETSDKGQQVPPAIADGHSTLDEVEDWYLQKVLGAHEGNLTQAAQSLGVDRSTLRRKLKKKRESYEK